MSTLGGQVSLVTGGGRGIGRAVSMALAAEGSPVGVLARSGHEVDATVAAIEGAGGRAIALIADVQDAAAVGAAVARVAAELGPVDLLVNNAGVNRVFGPLWEVDLDDWWQDVTINVRGPATCARAVLPAMVAQRSGRIVNIASGTAGRAFPYNSAYAASKAALVRLTDCLAAELADLGVKVFALGPGNVDSKMTRDISASANGKRWLGGVVSSLQFIPPEVAARAVVDLARGIGDKLNGRWLDAGDGVAAVASRAAEVAAEDLFQLRRRK